MFIWTRHFVDLDVAEDGGAWNGLLQKIQCVGDFQRGSPEAQSNPAPLGYHDACLYDACIHGACINDACIHDECVHDTDFDDVDASALSNELSKQLEELDRCFASPELNEYLRGL